MTDSELFDFDTPVERRGTGSMKWEKYKDQDIIPLWVADMDFRSPPAVIRAIEQRTAYGVFGYPMTPEKLNDRVVSMLREAYARNTDF